MTQVNKVTYRQVGTYALTDLLTLTNTLYKLVKIKIIRTLKVV